ncbi:MAG: hypothetical protein HC822_11635 [Oscillochloris sp.]|nr:hypothetical protein [Oscillochloris sp.]
MNDEIDLRPYISALLRHVRLIFGLALLVAVVAAGAAILLPRGGQAMSTVLIIPAASQINLDSRFVTRDATMLTNVTFQRQALIGLAQSNAIATQVAAEIPAVAGMSTEDLLNRIQVAAEGDLLRITASAASDAEALELAESWGRNYERLVTAAYSRNIAGLNLIGEQITDSQQRYVAAQTQLEQFLSRNELVEVEQQIKRINGLLDGSTNAGTALYTQYLSRTQELDLILADARTLQIQLQSNQSDRLADRLAALSLRARLVDAPAAAAATQLQIVDPAALATDPAAARADLAQLIAALEQQRDVLSAEAAGLADAIIRGETATIGLEADARRQYENELTLLRQQAEQLNGQQRALTQSRDIALSSLEVLQRKREEQQIAESTPLVSVLFLSSTISSPPSLLTQIVLQGAIGFVVGSLFGVLLALYLEVLRPRLATVTSTDPAPNDRPVASP